MHHLEDVGVDGKIIKMDLREIGCENGRWMELAQVCVHGISGVESLG
jgi:hypothetical protein